MDSGIYIWQKNILHVFWFFLRQWKEIQSNLVQILDVCSYVGPREWWEAEAWKTRISGHNFRAARKKLYAPRIHFVIRVTTHVKIRKWLVNVYGGDSESRLSSVWSVFIIVTFHLWPHFRSFPGVTADYQWTDSKLDIGMKPHGWTIFKGTPYCT